MTVIKKKNDTYIISWSNKVNISCFTRRRMGKENFDFAHEDTNELNVAICPFSISTFEFYLLSSHALWVAYVTVIPP